MRGSSTLFGEPLSSDSKKLVNEVRLRINQPIHPNFDTDFNIYRFILAAERSHRKEKEIIETASKALNNHLRFRKAFKLDSLPDTPFSENPLFVKEIMPRCEVSTDKDAHGRLLWFLDYASINVEAHAHTIRSSQSIRLQFIQFEHMLHVVNQQEEKTGRLTSIRHIIDLAGYEINPFTMLFVSNGSLTYYSHLMHYEHYPELVTPIEMVNAPKWIHLPYRIVRAMMPAEFADRLSLFDDNFLDEISKEIHIEHIPTSLGGQYKDYKCYPAAKFTADQYWVAKDTDLLNSLETIHISARKRRLIHVDVNDTGKLLSWYFRTDGDVFFGVFFQPFEDTSTSNLIISMGRQEKEVDVDSLEMVYPWMKLAARIVDESDTIECARPGRYILVFCNKHSWLQRRTVNLTMQVVDRVTQQAKRYHVDGTFNYAEPFEIPKTLL